MTHILSSTNDIIIPILWRHCPANSKPLEKTLQNTFSSSFPSHKSASSSTSARNLLNSKTIPISIKYYFSNNSEYLPTKKQISNNTTYSSRKPSRESKKLMK